MQDVIGLLSWIGVGLLVGLAARLLLPGRASWAVSMVSSVIGALVGAAAATLMDMGGTAELDPRALALAFLTAVLFSVVAQLVRVMRGAK